MSGKTLYFSLYAGADRTASVIFSEQYENLSSTKYVRDSTDIGNVALIGGAEEGTERITASYGDAQGAARYEVFEDVRDIARSIKWEDLIAEYPLIESGGEGYITTDGGQIVYKMRTIDVPILDEAQLTWLQTYFPGGTIVTAGGNRYYRTENATIAILQTVDPAGSTPSILAFLQNIIYMVYLINRGAEKLTEYGAKTTFESVVIPNTTFIYKQDYFLGDIVTIQSGFGITAHMRIVEVIEVFDENGYKMEPKFEYMEA